MKKMTLALAVLTSIILVGYASIDIYSRNVYKGNQAKEAGSISYGTIVSVRPMGAVGSSVLGGIEWATIGSKVEEKASQVDDLELTIKKDDGKEIVVVQKQDSNLTAGRRVRIVGGSTVNVSAL